MVRCGAKQAKGLEMIGRGVAFVMSETVLGEEFVPLVEEAVARDLGEDRSRGDRHGARVTLDEGTLLNEQVETHGVDEEEIGWKRELRDGFRHRLATGLVDIPGVDATRVGLRDGPRKRMLANAAGEGLAALGGKFLGVVQADDAARGIQDDGGGNDRSKEGTAAGFVDSGDASPAVLARFALVAGRAKPPHRRAF